jgi:hypothetical protein
MHILQILLFFPSITFGLISAEVFPYALAYSILFLRKLSYWSVLAVLIIGLSAAFTVLSGNGSLEVLRSLFAYLNPLLIFIILLQISDIHFEKIHQKSLIVFKIFCIVLVIQFSGLFEFLDPVFKAFVPRSFSTPIGFRGITLLSTEPSRASVEFLFLYTVFRFTLIKRYYWLICDLIVGACVILVFKSATGLLIYIAFVTLLNQKILFFILPFSFVLIISQQVLIDGRIASLIQQLSQLSPSEAWFLLLNTSGNRIVSVIAAINYAFHYPFGGGVGNWKNSSIEALFLTGIDYTNLNYFNAEWKDGALYFRMSGYLMNLILDVGFVSASIFILAITKYTYPLIIKHPDSMKIYLFFLFNIFFVGSVGPPVPWISTAIIIRYLSQNKKGQFSNESKY